MKTANFILSIFAALCSLGMIYGAIVTESPIKSVSVIIFSIIFVCYFIFLYVCERCYLATSLILLFINSIAKIDIVGNIPTLQ